MPCFSWSHARHTKWPSTAWESFDGCWRALLLLKAHQAGCSMEGGWQRGQFFADGKTTLWPTHHCSWALSLILPWHMVASENKDFQGPSEIERWISMVYQQKLVELPTCPARIQDPLHLSTTGASLFFLGHRNSHLLPLFLRHLFPQLSTHRIFFYYSAMINKAWSCTCGYDLTGESMEGEKTCNL